MNTIKFFLEKVYVKMYCMSLSRKTSTSISDNQSYPQVCIDAVNNFNYFNRFRRNPIYRGIVETVSEEIGQKYLDIIRKNQTLMDKVEEFKKNDNWGGPVVSTYLNIGTISPTTLRYVKVLSDLLTFFDNTDNLRICEIGVGYGGQCRIIDSVSLASSYCLVDIGPALQLSERYLSNYSTNAILSFTTMNELDYKDYDLCISNYAFSELPRVLQEIYLKKVILRSKMGYITYSDNFAPQGFNSFRVDELLKIIPNSVKIKEEPVTGPNYIIMWGNNNVYLQ